MQKFSYFFIDDVIWCLREIAKTKPTSIFDQPLLSVLKKAHDEYGLTAQHIYEEAKKAVSLKK